ncbi:MAG: alpha/beta fold hydrolase [Deltaproteobacteria bacterium]|nr:alpha/beta fold hydrolase [Deltaproteobacteria bacterium]MBI3065407.1 alpha/beta fold hydrolase [Deltaproteobacteria bacterium]
MSSTGVAQTFPEGLKSRGLLLKLTWDEWVAIAPPYPEGNFSTRDVTVRYQRNGYDWDIHGTLYTPEKELNDKRAFVLFHGGAGSEKIMDLTPDGRPGLARVLAAQGLKALALTYPGHYPPGGVWKIPIAERQPVYLMDRDLPKDEILDRNLKCTFNVILQGAGLLADQHLAGREILAFGHSTGGPMAAHLTRFSKKTKVIGLVGFGSGGPDGWRLQWRNQTGAETYVEKPVDHLSRRSPNSFRESGYIDPPDLTPWGGGEDYIRLVSPLRSQMKTSLCDNQHNAAVGILEEYPKRTGLPREEYFDHLQEPDPEWLKTIRVLLIAGENDKGHWVKGEKLENKREMFMGAKYAAATRGTHVVLIPRYGHVGYAELYNEKIAYLWLWAYKSGYFD